MLNLKKKINKIKTTAKGVLILVREAEEILGDIQELDATVTNLVEEVGNMATYCDKCSGQGCFKCNGSGVVRRNQLMRWPW